MVVFHLKQEKLPLCLNLKQNRFKKTPRKLVLQMQQCTLIPKRRHLVLKENSFAKHCLLVLRIHTNFSSLFASPLCPPQSRMFAAKILKCWLAQCIPPPHLFLSFSLECSIFLYRKAAKVKSEKAPLFITK